MNPDRIPGHPFSQARVARRRTPPPPFQPADYEDLVFSAGRTSASRASPWRLSGSKASTNHWPSCCPGGGAGLPVKQPGPWAEGDGTGPRPGGTPPPQRPQVPGPGCRPPLCSHRSPHPPTQQLQLLCKAAPWLPPHSATPRSPQALGPATSETSRPIPSSSITDGSGFLLVVISNTHPDQAVFTEHLLHAGPGPAGKQSRAYNQGAGPPGGQM